MSTRPGMPTLVDVTYTDAEASREFYRRLFGWEYDSTLDPTGHYTYAVANGKPIAGLRPAQPAQPVVWTLYLWTNAASSTAVQVKNYGGRIIYQNEAPGQGNVVIGADPAGATIGFWQPIVEWDFQAHQPNTLVWAELNTPDSQVADEFYRQLFDYKQQQIGDGKEYDYSVWALDFPILGRMRVEAEVPDSSLPHWLVYFGVDPQVGTDAQVERAVSFGATLVKEPEDIPSGRFAVLRDVAGATFAVIDNSRAANQV